MGVRTDQGRSEIGRQKATKHIHIETDGSPALPVGKVPGSSCALTQAHAILKTLSSFFTTSLGSQRISVIILWLRCHCLDVASIFGR